MTPNSTRYFLDCSHTSRPVGNTALEYGYSFACGGWVSNYEVDQWKQDTGYWIGSTSVGVTSITRNMALIFPDETEMTLFKMKFGITVAPRP